MKEAFKKYYKLAIIAGVVLLLSFVPFLAFSRHSKKDSAMITTHSQKTLEQHSVPANSPQIIPAKKESNVLSGRNFYIDNTRNISRMAQTYQRAGNISGRPGSTWLTGPSQNTSQNNSTAQQDVSTILRISQDAAQQKTTPIYILYALPHRDACATYSAGGFATPKEYALWVDQLIDSVKTPSIFVLEPDGIAQTIRRSCLSQEQVAERYNILKSTVSKLKSSPRVLAVYIDAGHSEWFPEPQVLVTPLKRSGIDLANGVSTNISNFIETPTITNWSQKLVKLLGDKTAIIDTSRNGRGAPDASVTGEARWCNPKNRGVGKVPTTSVNAERIDAYIWGKNIGESDGSCNGYPSAGTYVPELAIDLAQNAVF